MAVTVTHTKVCSIPDNQTNLARGEVCPSHWNDGHTLVGIDTIESNIRDAVFVDMGNADYTLTDAQANSQLLAIQNSGDGTKTLTWPTSSDETRPASQLVVTLFAAYAFTAAAESGGSTSTVLPGSIHIVSVPGGLGAFEVDGYIQDEGRASMSGIDELDAGDNYFSDGNAGNLQRSNQALANTLTILPANKTPFLTALVWCQGAGTLTIQGDTGVTVTGNTVLTTGLRCQIVRNNLTETYYCV